MAVTYTGNTIKCDGKITRIRFYKDNFGIIEFEVDSCEQGDIPKGWIINCKGKMGEPKVGQCFTIRADEYEDEKWGKGYSINQMYTPFRLDDPDAGRKFLTRVFNDNQLENIYAVYDNPIPIFEEGNMEKIVKIKGFGIKTGTDALNKYNKYKVNAKIYVELIDFDLTDNMIERLMETYKGNPDLVVDMVQKNPYLLCKDVYGVGFKKCDQIALSGGVEPYSPLRIGAFIRQYLSECANEGFSWIENDHLLGGILDTLGEDIPDEAITEALRALKDELWVDQENGRVGLVRSYKLEHKIAEEIVRLMKAESRVKNDDWMDSVKKIERQNGWEFTDEQIKAVEIGNGNNVFVLTGNAGSGKSTSVQAILEANKGRKFLQCALSGRAASKLFEITGEDGSTIHRALGFPQGEPEHFGFVYHEKHLLDVEIVVVDECSMIGGELFLSLLKAIPSGCKVILLGDTGQLPSIGSCNILQDIIDSGEVPCINLTKIHRQAAKSAVITESIKVRHGEQLIPKDWVGDETRGELQDLNIKCFSDKTNTFYEIMQRFTTEMNKPGFDIMECQILIPIKNKGDACTKTVNDTVQDLYNPMRKGMEEYKIYAKEGVKTFRIGDKVINTKNCYKTTSPMDEKGNKIPRPIFNGSLGIIKDIIGGSIIVDFAYIGEVEVTGDDRYGLELGYAITVHKFQGSSAKTIIFGIDFGSYTLLSKQLLYTGITRTEKMCYMICQTSALRYAVSQDAIVRKQTHLQDCLHEVLHPKLVF